MSVSDYWGSIPYTEWLPTKEQHWHNQFKVGDIVKNISVHSQYSGLIGEIVKMDFSIHVKYKHRGIGRHPAKILIKDNGLFDEDLFTI